MIDHLKRKLEEKGLNSEQAQMEAFYRKHRS